MPFETRTTLWTWSDQMPYVMVSNVSIYPEKAWPHYYRFREVAAMEASSVKLLGAWLSGPTHIEKLPSGAHYTYVEKAEKMLRRTVLAQGR